MIKKKELMICSLIKLLRVLLIEMTMFRLDDVRSSFIYTVADSVLHENTYSFLIMDIIIDTLFFACISRRMQDEKQVILYESRNKVLKDIFKAFFLFSVISGFITVGTSIMVSRVIYNKDWINWDDPVSACLVYNDFEITNVSFVEVALCTLIFLTVFTMINLGSLFIVKVSTNSMGYSVVVVFIFDCLLGWGIKGRAGNFFRMGYYNFKYAGILVGNAIIFVCLLTIAILTMFKLYKRKEWL